jgi:rhodanese-related sulfurtransferase
MNASQPTVTKAWDLVDRAKAQIDNLSPDELAAEIENGETVVVDIRDVRELYLKGKIPGAVHAPRGMLEFWIDPASEYYREVFDPSKRYVLYCAGGGRSALAAKVMKDMGYPDVGHLEPASAGGRLRAERSKTARKGRSGSRPKAEPPDPTGLIRGQNPQPPTSIVSGPFTSNPS